MIQSASSPGQITRRSFLAAAGGAGLAATAVAQPPTAIPTAPLQVGVIGLGSRGFNLLDELLKAPDVRVRALCDVDQLHYRDRPWGKGKRFGREPAVNRVRQMQTAAADRSLLVTDDFREVCGSDQVEAVVVATPDHWHALCTLTALRAGKDVYCEKPVTHTFREGQLVYREAAMQGAVFQTGSQQRSDPLFRRAVEIVRNGHLGRLQQVLVGLPPGYETAQGDTKSQPPPASLDYDLWCGPSAKLPYMRARHHRWWRGHTAFGGGVLMDWIGHHNDIAHWAMDLDASGPVKVQAVDWTPAKTEVYDTPFHYGIACRYENGVASLISSRNAMGARFIGERGWVHVRRGKLEASNAKWLEPSFDVGEQRVPESRGHMRNFIDCVFSRQPCIAPAETAHRSITPGHLAYVSHQLGRPLRWNPSEEQVIEDKEANRLLTQVNYRSPWKLT